jgi:hypoxanthine phosphoribosyltransferase
MDNKLLNALLAHYNAKIQRAEANMVNLFKNPVGVGSHSDIVGDLVTLVDEISSARSSIDVLNGYVQQPEEQPVESSD